MKARIESALVTGACIVLGAVVLLIVVITELLSSIDGSGITG
jgi:hypothetical protein